MTASGPKGDAAARLTTSRNPFQVRSRGKMYAEFGVRISSGALASAPRGRLCGTERPKMLSLFGRHSLGGGDVVTEPEVGTAACYRPRVSEAWLFAVATLDLTTVPR